MRILLVDDDPVVIKALEARLSKEGHQVFATTEAKEGLEFLENNELDLIISDIIMPYMSGIELLANIQMIKPKIPIILISALDQKELILTSFELGAKDFVIKPINVDELLLRMAKYE